MSDNTKTYTVKANDFIFSFTEDEINAIDLVQKSITEFNLISQHKSVNVKLLESDPTCKKVKMEADGESFDIEIKDELDQMLDKMGFGGGSKKVIKEVKAPMPGLVFDIVVKEGQAVLNGDKLLILEAMKMENSILIHADATIKKILVKTGDAVDKGQVLIELE